MDIDKLEVNEDKFYNNIKYKIIRERLFLGGLSIFVVGSFFVNLFTYDLKKNRNENIFSEGRVVIDGDSQEEIINILEDELDVEIPASLYDDYLLLNAIYLNNNLSDNEKDILYSLINIIEGNPYIDKEEAYYSLLNVDINNVERPENVAEEVVACYDYNNIDISIYEDNDRENVLRHEGIHCIICNDKNKKLPNVIVEGVTELLNNEYFYVSQDVKDKYYFREKAFVKILCEIVGAEKVLEAYTTGDMDLIYDELENITGTKREAHDAIDLVEKVCNYYQGDEYSCSDEEISLVKEIFDNYMTEKINNDEQDIDGVDRYQYNFDIFYEKPVKSNIKFSNLRARYFNIDKSEQSIGNKRLIK